MILNIARYYLFLILFLVFQAAAQAGTWGVMDYSSGKWGAIPDVYTVTIVEPSNNAGELVVFFSPEGSVEAAPETTPTSFFVTCGDVTVVSDGSPVTLTGLTVGGDYTCTVIATNSAGSSSASTGLIGTPGEGLYHSNTFRALIPVISILLDK